MGHAPRRPGLYRGAMAFRDSREDHPLTDEALAGEIELLGDVISAATQHEGRLPDQDLDDALGV